MKNSTENFDFWKVPKDYVEPEYTPPSLDWQLGCMVGEYIVATQLPTLSTDMLKSNQIIQVEKDLEKEWERKNKEYRVLKFDTEESNSKFYENLAWYKGNIEQKYLEKEIETLVPRVDPQNIEEFQKGIKDALLDCDMSHYRLKKMQPNSKYNVRTVIILQYEP